MTAEEAAELIRLFEENGIEVYVDGGWAVDALLGEQTRAHQDLDIALPQKHVARLRDLLGLRGYREQPRPDTWECNFVLTDARGNEVDVHSYTLDETGNNVGGVAYRREHLTGRGVINNYSVKCIPPEWLIRFHSGYALDENDYHDVRGLCERFGITLPEEYRRFIK
jgi:lincosamide nucleotidyltransferase A/C/D/E